MTSLININSLSMQESQMPSTPPNTQTVVEEDTPMTSDKAQIDFQADFV